MSKRLPYFQFEPAEWLAGDIMFCSLQAQGLYTTLMAIFWQKDCVLNLDQAIKRLGNKEIFDELISENIIKIRNGNISIDFLDEQWKKLSEKSKINSKNGALGGRPKKQTETETKPNGFNSVNKTETETKALRREEKKEEEKRKEEYICDFSETEFVEFFKTKRLEIDKQKSGYDKLITFEKQNFKNLINSGYTKQDFEDAVSGLFFQNTLPAVRIRPDWILKEENFTKMIDSWRNKKKIYSSDNNNDSRQTAQFSNPVL